MNTNQSRRGTTVIVFILIVVFIVRLLSHSFQSRNTQKESPGSSHPGNDIELNRNEDHLIFSKHARCRMECRHITQEEIKEILHEGKINYSKSDMKAERGPRYAVEGYLHDQQHLRVIFAPETNAMVVVTCIDLEHEWQCPSCN